MRTIAIVLNNGPIEYRHEVQLLRGYAAYPVDRANINPISVLVLPDGLGLGEAAKTRARMLAQAGHIALAADLYGDGMLARDVAQGHALSGALLADRQVLRRRVRAGLETLETLPGVIPSRIAVIGYCFGGTGALELARDGADIIALVCFHGALDTCLPAQAGCIKPRILVCTGADDVLVPMHQISAFSDEMNSANAQWRLILYGGAKHNFTNPAADHAPSPRVAYNPDADAHSWRAMHEFFAEV